MFLGRAASHKILQTAPQSVCLGLLEGEVLATATKGCDRGSTSLLGALLAHEDVGILTELLTANSSPALPGNCKQKALIW